MERVYLWHNQNRIQNGSNNYAMVRSKLWRVFILQTYRKLYKTVILCSFQRFIFSALKIYGSYVFMDKPSFTINPFKCFSFPRWILLRIQVQCPKVEWKPKLLMAVSEIWYLMTFWMKFGKDCRIWTNVLGSDVKDGSLSVWFSSSTKKIQVSQLLSFIAQIIFILSFARTF